jgi:hypothetical protein
MSIHPRVGGHGRDARLRGIPFRRQSDRRTIAQGLPLIEQT